MYHVRKYVQSISSQAPVEMDLDYSDHPLAMANWSQHSNNPFLKFLLQQQTDSSPKTKP